MISNCNKAFNTVFDWKEGMKGGYLSKFSFFCKRKFIIFPYKAKYGGICGSVDIIITSMGYYLYAPNVERSNPVNWKLLCIIYMSKVKFEH